MQTLIVPVKTVLTLFSTRVKMSAYANPFIELAPVLDATSQINSCNQQEYPHLIPYTHRETNEATFKSFI